jgi:SpoVK/Ycf46/Vps4 family AAA+-type ATPase
VALGTSVVALEGGDRDHLSSRLWNACRSVARPRLEMLAERIAPTAGWEDLILPEMQMLALRQLAAQSRNRMTVYERWGFSASGRRGLGLSALFSGPSGTGKTLAAEVLAADLRLDMYRVDLSAVVSKYIGETEKNLKQVFDAAETGGVLLLFDEADAIFGKRAEVKDSHDRYANIEVGYLLQRMESFQGIAVLTTNTKASLDKAFQRRLRFSVDFPFPDAAHRAAIWARVFPERTPTEALDAAKLASLNMSGGNIRNIALNAAFLAAEEGSSVRMEHLLQATQLEAVKSERPIAAVETRGWV